MSKPTLQAKRKCAEWLVKCLELGWRKDQLNALEKTWWKFHDENGLLNLSGEDWLSEDSMSVREISYDTWGIDGGE
jgi:hypothetical protein